MAKKALIVGAGECDLRNVDYKEYKFIMGCDGGVTYLSEAMECPHAIIGDFDSADKVALMEMQMLGVVRHNLPEEKDITDMKAAIDFIAKYDYDQIDIYGGYGSRLDHSAANMMLLFDLNAKGIKGRLVGSKNIITVISAQDGPAEMIFDDVPEGWYVSMVPVEECTGVSVKGMKYEMENETISYANADRCVSNEITDGPGKLTLEKGRMIVFYSVD